MKRVAAAAIVVLAAGPATGCGDDPAPVHRALQRADAAGASYGARYTFRGTTTQHGVTIPVRGYGQVEPGGRRLRLVITANALRPTAIDAAPRVYADRDSVRFFLGAVVTLPAGTRWLGFDDRRVPSGFGRGRFLPAYGYPPARWLHNAALHGEEVKRDGEATIGGRRVTRYSARYALHDKRLPDELRNAKIGFELWIDADDLVRRARSTLDGQGYDFDVTDEVTAYDRGLRVALPPRREVHDATVELRRVGR